MLLSVLTIAIGCGKGDGARVPVYPVSGKVLVNGKPAAGATVAFFLQGADAEQPDMPVPSANVDQNGDFKLRSYIDGDGAPAGDYRVTVVWPVPPPPNATVFDTPDRLRGRFANPDSSGITATVEQGNNELQPFDLK